MLTTTKFVIFFKKNGWSCCCNETFSEVLWCYIYMWYTVLKKKFSLLIWKDKIFKMKTILKAVVVRFFIMIFILLSIYKFFKKYMQYCFIIVFSNIICNWSTCVMGNGFNCLIKRIVCNILLTFFRSFYCNRKLKVDRVFSNLLFLFWRYS